MEHVIGQYADDTFLLLDGEENHLREFQGFKRYERVSGFKVNVEKTCAVWLGDNKTYNKICPELPIQWVEFKLLGVTFCTNLDKMKDINYNSKLSDIEKLLKEYKKCCPTLLGKITVINTLAIPKLVLMSVLPNPDKYYGKF